MNSRLISNFEKQLNARGRRRRNQAQKLRKRRCALLDSLTSHLGNGGGVGVLVSPEDAFGVMFRHGNRARNIVRRVKIQAGTTRGRADTSFDAALPEVPRPSRVLEKTNRSWILSSLVPPEATVVSVLSLPDALKSAGELRERDGNPYGLLDSLALSGAISLDLAAALLYQHGLVPAPFTTANIESAREARQFWNNFEAGRNRYHAALSLELVAPAAGNWALFGHGELHELLPGLHVPQALRRDQYVAQLTHGGGSLLLNLDVYSTNRRPLFRHPI